MTVAPYPLARRREWSRAQALAWVHYRSLAAVQRIGEMESAKARFDPKPARRRNPEWLLDVLLAADDARGALSDLSPRERTRTAETLLDSRRLIIGRGGRYRAAELKTAFPRATGKEKGRARNTFPVAQWKLDIVVPFLLANTYRRGLLNRFCEDYSPQKIQGKRKLQYLVSSPKDKDVLKIAASAAATRNLDARKKLRMAVPDVGDFRKLFSSPATKAEIRACRENLDSWR